MSLPAPEGATPRESMQVDIACVGFGAATAGFLTMLSRQLVNPDGTPAIESPTNPSLPLQVVCYERADDIAFGVSGVVNRARGIRASHRSAMLHFGDGLIRAVGFADHDGVELPDVPLFLHKEGGMVISLGQFMQWIGADLRAAGTVQIWPGTPVLVE